MEDSLAIWVVHKRPYGSSDVPTISEDDSITYAATATNYEASAGPKEPSKASSTAFSLPGSGILTSILNTGLSAPAPYHLISI